MSIFKQLPSLRTREKKREKPGKTGILIRSFLQAKVLVHTINCYILYWISMSSATTISSKSQWPVSSHFSASSVFSFGGHKVGEGGDPPPFFFFLGFAFSNIAFPLNTHGISSSLMFVDGCTSSGHSSLKERVASHPLRMSHHCDSMSKFFLGREETAVSLLGQNRESGNHVDTCQMKKAEVER